MSAACLLVVGCAAQSRAPLDAAVVDTEVAIDASDEAAPLFEPASPFSYVAKVKNLLVGLPASDGEVAQVAADPTQLKALIAIWMQLPQYRAKMKRFFELAFQQTQISTADFADQVYPGQLALNATTAPLLLQDIEESFARTMLQLIDDGKPLTESVITGRLMMTTALKELYAFLDVWQVDNAGKVTDRFKQANPKLSLTVETSQGALPIADTLDPTSSNYMHWYNPDVATEDSQIADCTQDPIVYPANALTLHYLFYGSLDNRKSASGIACPPLGGSASAPQLASSDFSDWTMVSLRLPAAGEATTRFYDLPTLRAASELVLSVPRVGFFSTPAFFANWQTNISNQMRVTLNQTLIVALGASIDGTDTTVTPGTPPPGLDAVHASSGDCLYCHQSLDPLRSIFASTYSWNYHNQLDTSFAAQKGLFAFHGVIAPVTTVADFGAVLAGHPLFAQAWVQKLCAYANSVACAADDPEFQRIVGLFQSSGYSWNNLVAELLASPLTTHAAETRTADVNGEVIAVSRRDHLCAALDARLGFADVCGRDAATKKQQQASIIQLVSGLPSDGYGRGATMPVLPNSPTLFYRAATENLCEAIAADVIDVPTAKRVAGVAAWSSAQPDAAIADFVSTVMALVASDPRSAPAAALLKGHFTAATAQGASASDALKSTFVAACLAPSSTSIGL
jgi:hypothetical protein